MSNTCKTCKSKGFPASVLGRDRCTFCDGTEDGHPPNPLTKKEVLFTLDYAAYGPSPYADDDWEVNDFGYRKESMTAEELLAAVKDVLDTQKDFVRNMYITAEFK